MRIAVVGGYGVGLTMRVTRAPEAGETVIGGGISTDHGGKGSNQAIGMSRLGATVSLLTAIGSDAYADEARRVWDAEGVAHEHVLVSSAATMSAFIIVDAQGENRIAIAPGALLDLTATHVEAFRPVIAASDMVVVSLEVPPSIAWYALAVAREHGVPTLLNPAPAVPIPDHVWPLVDVLTPNRGEADACLGDPALESDPRNAGRPRNDESDRFAGATATAERLRRRSNGVVIMTLGGDGAVIASAARTVTVPALPVTRVIDTTGAGDAFTAALAVSLCRGLDPIEATREAQRAGAFAVTREGVVPALPYVADLAQ